jgi:putative tryptophan/tyrosine transport system substrate-binding protein
MRRREVIALIGGAAAALPLAARAQQRERMRRIGLLLAYLESDPDQQEWIAAFRTELEVLGWTEGRNVQSAYRWGAEGRADRARALAEELVSTNPDVILVVGGTEVVALSQVTRSIPIVFQAALDLIARGLVTNLARPGGNVTGFTALVQTLGAKWVQMLKEIAPAVARVLVLNPGNPDSLVQMPGIEATIASIGAQVIIANVLEAAEIERAIETSAREPNLGMIVLPSSAFARHHDRIIALAARHRVPTVYSVRSWTVSGGLISYGIDHVSDFRRAASYVDRILKGEKPGDLPIQQPTKYELVINLKTAKTLGLTVPRTLLTAADELIQ